MIGIACAPDERATVREFFELFKTPWGFRHDGGRYDILIVTAEADVVLPENGHVVVVFGSRRTWIDESLGIETGVQRNEGSEVEVASTVMPLHGPTLPLKEASAVVLARLEDGSPVALQLRDGATIVIRCGYDLFAEIERLLGEWQQPTHAGVPTLDLHIDALRRWLVETAGLLVEIPPVRETHPYAVCLTHDIDFLALRRHRCDRTLLGFLYRAAIGSIGDVVTRRRGLRALLRNWSAVATLPLVYFGRVADPWQPFTSYLEADPARSTFFVIPFRDDGGEGLDARRARRRRVAYDVDDIATTLQSLHADGYEIAVHGIDAWNSLTAARKELERVGNVVDERSLGVRMHWLCSDAGSYTLLEQAGYDYDATCGYNDTVGFRAGTAQVFRPHGVEWLLELPLHVQDTALFFPDRMHLKEPDAWVVVDAVRRAVRSHGGVLTLSWHDRSLAPERLWDRFYERVLTAVRSDGVWFGTAREIVEWFRLRRSVTFGAIERRDSSIVVELAAEDAGAASAGLVLRVHLADEREPVNLPWHGEARVEIPLRAHGENQKALR